MKSKKMLKISVLIPIYNVEKYLEECLESVCDQTLKDIEIICINDGSTDSSLKIIKDFQKNDDRIVLIDKKNSGYGDSMNKGLEKATGEYIGIVESDDFIEKDAFEKLYNLAKKNEADVARGNYYHYKEGKSVKYSYIDEHDIDRPIDPARRNWIFYQAPAIWSAIYKKSFLDENGIRFLPTPGASYQDTGFNFKVWASTKRAVFTDEAFLHYRLDNESSSVNNPGKVLNVCKEYAEIEQFLKEKNIFGSYCNVMEASKFGAYYWNIYRLKPNLRKDFVKKTKDEFSEAKSKNILVKQFFLDDRQWKLLNFIVDHPIWLALIYIRFSGEKKKPKAAIKKILVKMRPNYRKQLEISDLISDLYSECSSLRQQVKDLERDNGQCKK